MADRINPSDLPLPIHQELAWQPRASEIPLLINRKLGSLDRRTYVYAGKLPLRIEKRITDRPPASALPLAVDRPYKTIDPARYVSPKALPLSVSVSHSEQPHASALPFRIDRELHTVASKQASEPELPKEILPEFWQSSVFGKGLIRADSSSLLPVGFVSSLHGQSSIYAEVQEGFFSSNALKLPIAVSTQIRPPSSELPLSIYREHGQWLRRPIFAPTNRKYIYPETFIASKVSEQAKLDLNKQYVLLQGIDSQSVSWPYIKNKIHYVDTKSWRSSSFGAGINTINRNQRIVIQGFSAAEFGRQYAYNLLQFIPLASRGFNANIYGSAYFQGGVKYLEHRGADNSAYGKPLLINTTADQRATAIGIKPQVLPMPSVSPRILYANSFDASRFGSVLLERSPMPIGEDHSRYGNQTVWYHTRPLYPSVIDAYNTGYPKVYDPTQFIQTPALIEQGIFGDTRIKNTTEVLRVLGIAANELPDYHYFENKNKYIPIVGVYSASFGATDIINKSPSVIPDGIVSAAIGISAIAYRIRRIANYGINQLVFGRPTLTKTPEIAPAGISAVAFGNTTTWHKNRTIELSGIAEAKAGVPITWFRYRYVAPTPFFTEKVGAQVITHGVRELITQGALRDSYGMAWVSFGSRLISPKGLYKDFESNHLVGKSQDVLASGFVATLFGERITPESQSVYTTGFTGALGLPVSYLQTNYLTPKGFISVGTQEQDRWNIPRIYNLTQYIQQEFDVNSGLSPIRWSSWTLLENSNKTIGIASFNAQRFGYSSIDNNAEVLRPEPTVMEILPDTAMVAYRVRRIKPDGMEAPYISSWSVVYNDADVINPQTFAAELLGKPALENTRRYYQWIGAIDSLSISTPMISFRIRDIDVEKRYSIGPPIMPMPTFDLKTKYIECAGFNVSSAGSPSLSIYRAMLTTRWTHREFAGEPFVKNLTPELLVYGSNSEEFGVAGVRLQYRYLLGIGDNLSLFGLSKIADRTFNVSLAGWNNLVVSQKHNVIRMGAPPYSEQRIDLDGKYDDETKEYTEGYGINPSFINGKPQVSAPKLNHNVIYVHNTKTASGYGTPLVRANSIYVDGGIYDHYFGTDVFIGLKKRVIDVDKKGISNVVTVGKPSLSPHTIYAVMEAPYQAVMNHIRRDLHYVDGYGGKPVGAVFGYVSVENRNRSVYARGVSAPYNPTSAHIYNKRKIVKCTGIAKPYMPAPSIPFVDQIVEHEQKASSMSFGATEVVVTRFDMSLSPRGFAAQLFSTNRVEGYIRNLYPTGFSSLRVGASKGGDTPYMWQGLRVGEYVPFTPDSDDMLAMGDTMISLTVRQVELQGFNTFSSTYDIGSFDERIKVRNAKQEELPHTKTLDVVGFDAMSADSIAHTYNYHHFIRPDGNSGQFRKGGYHA